MPTATLTSKGQITLPAALRARLHLEPGDQLDFWEDDTGVLRVSPRVQRLDALFGVLRGGAAPLSIDEMDDVIGEAATQEYLS